MDFRWTPEQEKLRQEVRSFLQAEYRTGNIERTDDFWSEGNNRPFSKKCAARGYIGMTWPQKYGGGGKTYLDRYVVSEEMARFGAPVAAHWSLDRQFGPSLIHHGTEWQREEFLPRMLRADVRFVIGMSEPDAGSDAANIRTRAREDGDDFIIDGQKIWTSGAHNADFIYMTARTDPDAPKHRGISEFLVETRLPGVTLRPIIDITGEHHFNEVFLDAVHVPRRYLVGEKNRGWYQIMAQVDYERSGVERLMSNYLIYEDMLKFVQEPGPGSDTLRRNPVIRHKLAELAVEYEVGRLLNIRVAWVLTQERIPNYEASLAKVFGTEWQQRMVATAMEILGPYSALMAGSPAAILAGRVAKSYLRCRGYTIMAGTSEVQRSVMATRGLRLPAG